MENQESTLSQDVFNISPNSSNAIKNIFDTTQCKIVYFHFSLARHNCHKMTVCLISKIAVHL